MRTKLLLFVCSYVVFSVGFFSFLINSVNAQMVSELNLTCPGSGTGTPYNGETCHHNVCTRYTNDCSNDCSICVNGVRDGFAGDFCQDGCCWLDPRNGATGCVQAPECTSCSCIAPSGVNWNSPGSGAVIGKGSVLNWTNASNWGQFAGGCEGSCSSANTGSYTVYANGVNITDHCKEGSGGNIVQPTNTCTLINIPDSWAYGSNINFEVIASNGGCSASGITRTFKFSSQPVINTVQISSDGINFHNHCGNNNTQLSCEANSMCIWNSVKTRCQAYLNNGMIDSNGRFFSSFKNNDKLFVKSYITDPDGYSDLASIGFYLDSQDISKPSRPLLDSVSRSRYDNGMLLLKNIYGDGRWALRGMGYIGTASNNYACNCGLESGLTKNCDGSYIGGIDCSTKVQSSCTGNCRWNYTYGYCQPINSGFGCVENYIIHPWRIGVEMINSNYWNTGIIGANGSGYTICSLGGASEQIDSAVNGECTTGGISGRVTSQTLSSNGYITNRYKSVSDDSVKLYFRIHALDKFAVREKNNFGNWTMIGGPDGGTCGWVGDWAGNWSCGRPGPLNVYVDNSVPAGGIGYSTSDLPQGSIKLLFNVSDAIVGSDGGGLRASFSASGNDGSKGIDNLMVRINNSAVPINITDSGLTITSNNCNSLSAGTLSFNCEVIVNGLSGGSDYKFFANVTDLAGNSRDISLDFDYAGPWFETVDGDLYSGGPITNDIPSIVPPRFTSTYLLYTGGQIISATSSKSWSLDGYSDANGDIVWYSSLSEIAEINTGMKFQDFPAISLDNFSDSINQVYRNTGDFTIDSTIVTCSGKKVIFVGGNLILSRNINVTDLNSGCLFIVRGDLTIDGTVTELNAGFIVEGNVIIKNSYNMLVINGFLFSTSQVKLDTKDTSCDVKCGRDLFVTDNLLNPSEQFVYDPRYIDIMREFLGRKKIENFTCGTVDREECGD